MVQLVAYLMAYGETHSITVHSAQIEFLLSTKKLTLYTVRLFLWDAIKKSLVDHAETIDSWKSKIHDDIDKMLQQTRQKVLENWSNEMGGSKKQFDFKTKKKFGIITTVFINTFKWKLKCNSTLKHFF